MVAYLEVVEPVVPVEPVVLPVVPVALPGVVVSVLDPVVPPAPIAVPPPVVEPVPLAPAVVSVLALPGVAMLPDAEPVPLAVVLLVVSLGGVVVVEGIVLELVELAPVSSFFLLHALSDSAAISASAAHCAIGDLIIRNSLSVGLLHL
jgi:hypothetical protein